LRRYSYLFSATSRSAAAADPSGIALTGREFLRLGLSRNRTRRLAFAGQSAAKSCQAYETEPEHDEGDVAAGSLTATGFAAREAQAAPRKHNIATAPLLLRA